MVPPLSNLLTIQHSKTIETAPHINKNMGKLASNGKSISRVFWGKATDNAIAFLFYIAQVLEVNLAYFLTTIILFA